MSIYKATVPQLAKMLRNLDAWLVKAAEYAASRHTDPDDLTDARLAPDQFTLTRQVQSACDTAKFTVARLTGGTAPSHPDTETTLAALRERIAVTVAYIESVDEAAFQGASARIVPMPYPKGLGAVAGEYLNGFALPNFYFHVTTAYAILRHSGVPLGKLDFLGGMDLQPV